MNLSTQQTVFITIDSLIIILSSCMICISTGIFTLIIYHLIKTKNSANQVALILTANMYIALIFLGITCLIQYTYSLRECLYFISANNGIYCQILTYFQLVSICAVYYTNSLQSIYRLCRIIFHTNPYLKSLKLYKKLIVIQWMICFISLIPALLVGDLKYFENDHSCQLNFTDLRSVCVNGALIYHIPVGLTLGCYVYTLKKIPKKNNHNIFQPMTQIQQIIARRDLLVLSRICTLLGLLLINNIPSSITVFNYYINGYIPWWSTQTACLIFILSATSVSLVSALIFPHVSNLLTKHHHRQQVTDVPLSAMRIK